MPDRAGDPGYAAGDSGYPAGDSGYHSGTDSGYRSASDSGYRGAGERNGKPRHGKSRDRHQPPESGAHIPMFNRRDNKPAPPRRRRSAPASSAPFGELTGYIVPIMVAVVIVMVLVVLLLNR